jgi:uncharacterized protein YjeT (DUF2065 family)
MTVTLDLTAWTSTLLGFYVFFAGMGALRNPAAWQTMIAEVGKSPALQLVAGLLELLVGALVYLANPWVPTDLLSCVLKAFGGLMMIEALVIAGFADIYTHFWLRTMNHMHRGWAVFTMLFGLAFALLGMFRFG